MPSRINNTIWGSPSDWIYSNNSQQQCKMCKIYYPDIVYAHNELLNEFYDTSVSVWGVPFDCSVGRKTTVSWYADSSKNVIVEYTEPHLRTNVPLTMLATSGATPNGNRYNRDPYVYNYYNCRIKDDVSIVNRSFSETFPSGTRSATRQFMTTGGGTSPQYNLPSLQTTYYDYRRNIHAINATVMPKSNFGRGSAFLVGNDLDTIINTTWNNLKTNYEYENDDDIVITGASYIVYSGLRMALSDAVRADIQGSAFLYPQVSVVPSTRTKAIYYTANNDKIGDGIYQNVNHIGLGFMSSGTLKYPNLSTLPTATTYFNNKTTAYSSTNDVMSQCDNVFAISRKKQKFADVEYHWGVGLIYGGESLTGSFNLVDIDNLSLSGITSNQEKYISMVPYLIIDDDKGNGYKLACKYALMHEYAFYGMPFTTSNSSAINTVWDNTAEDIYIPLFDENMITTGEYVTLKKAFEQYLPQTVWTDLFNEQSIYNYDPDFQPDPPSPEESDYGDTSNLGSARGLFPAGVNIYLMSRSDYNIFMGELNSYYQGSSPDDWTLDFQGVNPSDYILSAYYTPYNFLKSENKSAVKIGPLTLTTDAYELSQGSPPDDPNKWKTFTYGTRKVTPSFYDFRDYEPYTTVELYLPLAGTVQLETAYVMNHDITVTYYFDLMSRSGVACVYRDSMLYKTSDFQLGCQVPLLSQNMGDIQNQIMSLDTARKQNNIRLTAATTATTGSAIKALSGKASDVSNLAGGAGLLQIASSVVNADKIDYDLTHTPASISVTGAAEPMNNYSVGQLTPKLIIKRPLMLPDKNDTIYSHTVGNACLINTTVGEMSGLIVCSNVDLSGIAATSTELSAIQSALTTGIYV